MSSSVGKGAVVLTVGGLVCKLFGGLFRLPLTNIIGLRGIAVFQMVMTIYSFAIVVVSGGVTNSLSKLVSSARARGEHKAIGGYLKNALIFSLVASGLFAFVFLLFSRGISSFQGAIEADASYKLLSLMLPLGALIGVGRGVIQGYGDMSPTAISQIIEQVLKFAFGLIFAYLFIKNGIAGGVFGAILGIVVSELFACLYIGVKLKKKTKVEFVSGYKNQFYKAALPLTFGGLILPLSHTIESLFIVKLLAFSGLSQEVAASIYGIQTGVVGAILNFPLVVSLALSAALLPNLSFMAEQGDYIGQKTSIAKAMHAMWFLLVPLVVGIMAVAGKLYPLIYPRAIEGYLDIALQLTYVTGISIMATALMQQLVAILQANGFFRDSMVFYIIGGVAKIIVLVVVAITPSVSPFSIAVSNIVLAAVVCLCVIIKMRGIIALSFFDLSLPLVASAVVFMVVQILLSFTSVLIGLILSVFIGAALYFVLCLPLTSKYLNVVYNTLKKKVNKFAK